MTTDASGTRLNKFISETGICSRREADRLIEDGLVQVNGQTAGMGVRVGPEDRVTVRGKPLRAKPKAVYLVYNKPVGITCTTDQAISGNIVDAVKYPKGRIFPIGRLDKPSEGLILLTNDGDIVNKILRAGNAHEKEYIVTVDKPFSEEFVKKMSSGVPILDTVTRPCQVRQMSANTFNIILTQGLNRQIRRMTEYLGYNVVKLKRVRVMNIQLHGLQPGRWRELSPQEMAIIEDLLQGSSKTEEASRIAPADKPEAAAKPGRRSTQAAGKSANSGSGRVSDGRSNSERNSRGRKSSSRPNEHRDGEQRTNRNHRDGERSSGPQRTSGSRSPSDGRSQRSGRADQSRSRQSPSGAPKGRPRRG